MKANFLIPHGAVLLVAGLLSFNHSANAADTPAGWQVQVTGVRVVGPAPGGNQDLRAFNWEPGVTVAMAVTSPEGKIIDVNQDDSKLDSFTDDKGGNLLAGADDNGFHQSRITHFGFNQHSSQSTSVEINAPGQPTKGATEFTITGSLAVKTAGDTTEYSADAVTFKPGTEFNLGKIKLKISAVEAREDGCGVTLHASQDLSSISTIEFFDDQGNKVEAERGETSSSSSWGSVSEMSVDWTYNLKKTLSQAKITATCWTDSQMVTVPFNIKTGLGL